MASGTGWMGMPLRPRAAGQWADCAPPSCCAVLIRSHVVVGKGGKLLDVQNGISPGDSFEEAAAFCAANKQA